jgi:hypothetical protein
MARLFDSTEYVSRTSGPSATAFTLMAWYRVDSYAAPADWQGLLDLRTASGLVCEVTLDASGNLDLWNNSSSVALIAHPAVGDWFHVYVRCSGSGAGLLQGGAALVGNAYTTNTHTIGFTGTANLLRFGGNAFDTSNHRLAAIKVWDVALTDAEIEAERYLYQPRKFANLHLWAPMVQSVLADQLKDFSGNARDFTATGTHAVVDGPPISWGAPGLFYPYAAGTPAGALDKTLDALTSAATGAVALAGALSKTLADVVSNGAGTVALAGVLGKALADATLSAAGKVALAGVSAPALGNATLAATGVLALKGSATITLDGVGLTAAGVNSSPLPTINGVVDSVLDGVGLLASGNSGGWAPVPPEAETWSPVSTTSETWTPVTPTSESWNDA